MKKILILLTLAILLVTSAEAKPKKYHEKFYQTLLCNLLDGVMEQSLLDRTRVDCLTDEYAIEVDFAKKWAESIGQSLYYAHMTGMKPAVGLIVKDTDADRRHLNRLQVMAKKYHIMVFIISSLE